MTSQTIAFDSVCQKNIKKFFKTQKSHPILWSDGFSDSKRAATQTVAALLEETGVQYRKRYYQVRS